MPIPLSAIGESLIVRIANELRDRFLTLCGAHFENDQLSAVEHRAHQEVKIAPYAGISFDGASRVDMIFLVGPLLAIPFEIKLGTTRLSKSRIDDEWLSGCEWSHGNRRFKGNMMSILERKFPASVPNGNLKVELPDNREVVLTPEWCLIARQRTLDGWHSNGRPAFSDRVRFLSVEAIVSAYGGHQAFNDLVRNMLSFDYYNTWFDPEAT